MALHLIAGLGRHRKGGLAAGLSSRFAPISYEKSKGLLKVRGEVLIERQIRQLKEAGIDDITVVVGYKKEYFFYLKEKFGVRIVVNPEYAIRNNNGTLWRVRDILGNTYDYLRESATSVSAAATNGVALAATANLTSGHA